MFFTGHSVKCKQSLEMYIKIFSLTQCEMRDNFKNLPHINWLIFEVRRNRERLRNPEFRSRFLRNPISIFEFPATFWIFLVESTRVEDFFDALRHRLLAAVYRRHWPKKVEMKKITAWIWVPAILLVKQ